MLKGIPAVIGPDLLFALAQMGHGDDIAIVDANFPATSHARRLCRADGIDGVKLVGAIADLMPIETGEACAAWRMAAGDEQAAGEPEVAALFRASLAKRGYIGSIEPLDRHAFYERAAAAFVVVATGERRFFGNLILRKGVIA